MDYLAVTHGDPDHVGGAAAVLRDFRPREIWEGVPVPRSDRLRELAQAATVAGAAWRTLQTGDILRLGEVEVRVWHPPPPDWQRQQVRNDDSLVLELRHGVVSIILPGDIGGDVESRIGPRLEPVPLRVLKVPHHGSRTSSSAGFLRALRPRLGIVSAGRDSRFGHPHAEVVRRYHEQGATVLQTGQVGAVEVCSDGRRLRVTTERPFRRFTIQAPS